MTETGDLIAEARHWSGIIGNPLRRVNMTNADCNKAVAAIESALAALESVTTVTDEDIEAFKRAWHEADAEGYSGNRVRRGLEAVMINRDSSPYDKGTCAACGELPYGHDNFTCQG